MLKGVAAKFLAATPFNAKGDVIMNFAEHFEKVTKHTFKNKTLLKTALTHSSYANEKKSGLYNERLEFLGDSVLSLVVSNLLYSSTLKLKEGEMSKIRANLVCEKSLAECAEKMNIGKYLYLGTGEERTGGRERASILADATEALIAALYLDGGFEKASEFVSVILKDNIKLALEGEFISDYKTELQEKIQSDSSAAPEYKIIAESGPDHNKTFEAAVYANSQILGRGTGKTKKDAEQAAAKSALFGERK